MSRKPPLGLDSVEYFSIGRTSKAVLFYLCAKEGFLSE
jgi:hypothetical protein